MISRCVIVFAIACLSALAQADEESPSDGETFTNSIGMKLMQIKAGSFAMGNPDVREGETKNIGKPYPEHRVQISLDFFLGNTEVTQNQWTAVMDTSPWKGKDFVREGPDYAATYVSWEDAVQFCNQLSKNEHRTPCYKIRRIADAKPTDPERLLVDFIPSGVGYRLPTEAEWEYACRTGTKTTLYSFGDDSKGLGAYAWFKANTYNVGEKYAHQVGLKRPNEWGLYDMHANLAEWCQDWLGQYDSAAAVDPTGPLHGTRRVSRGGCWFVDASFCQSSMRDGHFPTYRINFLGFRVVRVLAE
ncbi:MAG: formylglycine-generating enzyme family protein [Pirellulaceae bacterium]|nr:formylglycine-generating enzyme family protein [Planctomycetaceae bacterium]